MTNLYDVLIHPQTQEKLILNAQNQFENSLNDELFTLEVRENIPIILPKRLISELQTSEFHKKTHTPFNYLEHYQKDAEVFDYFEEYESALTRDEIHRLHQTILRQIPDEANLILDVGCGNGWLSNSLIPSKTVISMDISFDNPKKALTKYPHTQHFGLVADVFHLPIAPQSIDGIVASEIIEHVANPALFIASLMKVLKKGGKLIITTPYNEKLDYSLCVHCNKPTPRHAHIHSFNEKNITKLIPSDCTQWSFKTFSNTWMMKLRISWMLSVFPYSFWKLNDNLFNKLIKRPARLMITLTKS